MDKNLQDTVRNENKAVSPNYRRLIEPRQRNCNRWRTDVIAFKVIRPQRDSVCYYGVERNEIVVGYRTALHIHSRETKEIH